MNRTQHPEATLRGYEGPYYPKIAIRLDEMLGGMTSQGLGYEQLVAACQQVEGFDKIEHFIETQDGHRWYSALQFSDNDADDEEIVTLFLLDAERAIAVYCTPVLDFKKIDWRLQRLISALGR